MKDDKVFIHRVLISLTNKEKLQEFALQLLQSAPRAEIIASGGTAEKLKEGKIPFTPLSDYTGFPECFGGRLKTLHPRIVGGILFRREVDGDEAESLGIAPIDLVVCNLYDFEKAAQDNKREIEELVEHMDIGGSVLIRSACKNFSHVAVVVDPSDYSLFLQELSENGGSLCLETRKRLAVKAMNASADYEALISQEFSKRCLGETMLRLKLGRGKELRYGENPDQEGWLYHGREEGGIAKSQVLSGKELSYNNLEDASAAHRAAQGLLELRCIHGAAIIKHGSLCGYATGKTLLQAFQRAWKGDSKSAFGGVVAFTSCASEELIPELKGKFLEVIIAPEFSEEFVRWVSSAKQQLRLLQVPLAGKETFHYKNVSGGMLVQTAKKQLFSSSLERLFLPCDFSTKEKVGVVTQRQPMSDQKGLFTFGVAAVNYAKSNAVAIVRECFPGQYQLLGMGSGQPNRVDSLERLAIPKAIENIKQLHQSTENDDFKTRLRQCVLASDGFFPFDDSVRVAAENGIRNCIQPGGSVRDSEVIKAADEADMCMIFTGDRYFSH